MMKRDGESYYVEMPGDTEKRLERALRFVQENPVTASAWGLDTAVNVIEPLRRQAAQQATEIEKLRDALEHIANVLGGGACGSVACDGCGYEMGEASETAHEALDLPDPRHPPSPRKTHPLVEERDALREQIATLTREREAVIETEGNRIVEGLAAIRCLDLRLDDADGCDSADVVDGLRAMIDGSRTRAVEAALASLRGASERPAPPLNDPLPASPGPAQPRAEQAPCPRCKGRGRIPDPSHHSNDPVESVRCPNCSPRPAERREEPHESDWFRRAVSNAHQQVLAQALGVYLVMGYLPSARADMRDEILTVLRAQDRAAVRAYLEQRVQALEAEAERLRQRINSEHQESWKTVNDWTNAESDAIYAVSVLKAELAALDRTIQGGQG